MQRSVRFETCAVVTTVLCLVLAALGCSDDLPSMDPIPSDDDDGMRMDDQSEAGKGSEAGSGGMSVATGSGGRGGASAADGGRSGGSGGAQSTSAGSSASGSGGMMSGGAMSGTGGADARPSGGSGGAAGAKPAGPVVAACMGRAGETVCDNAVMIKCGDAGEAANRETCDTPDQCRAGLAAGSCGMCDPGELQCEAAELRECSMTGEWTVKETCKSEALCDDTLGACEAPACEADQHKCEANQLSKCKDDLTGFEVLDTCPMELCDEAGKKCNVCVPSIKECEGNTLKTCAADGSGFTEMACTAPANKCVEDRCVQCTSNAECMVDNPCMETSCNIETGMCNTPRPKTVGTSCSANGGQKCNLTGQCVECNLDSDCSPSQRCSLVFGCVERAALQAGISIISGTVSVTLNAGYGLRSSNPDNLGSVSFSSGFLGTSGVVSAVGEDELLQPSDSARTVTFTGPGGQTCQPSQQTDTRVVLRFSTNVDPPSCDQSVTITAFE